MEAGRLCGLVVPHDSRVTVFCGFSDGRRSTVTTDGTAARAIRDYQHQLAAKQAELDALKPSGAERDEAAA
jgi:hypothetical protein